MEQTIEDSTITKINNLLAIANHETANENEAHIAMVHVQRLLAKYNLSLQEFDRISNPVENINKEKLENGNKSMPQWKTNLLSAIAKANFCSIYLSTSYRHTTQVLVGRPTNVQGVKILYSFLCSVIENEAKSAFAKYTGWEHGKTYCNSFRLGMVDRISERLQEEKAKVIEEVKALNADNLNPQNVNSKSIVVRDPFQEAQKEIQSYYQSIGLKLRTTQYSGVNKSGSGYSKGREAGNRCSLNTCNSLNAKNY